MIKIAGIKSNDKINFKEFVDFFYKVDWSYRIMIGAKPHLTFIIRKVLRAQTPRYNSATVMTYSAVTDSLSTWRPICPRKNQFQLDQKAD